MGEWGGMGCGGVNYGVACAKMGLGWLRWERKAPKKENKKQRNEERMKQRKEKLEVNKIGTYTENWKQTWTYHFNNY